MAHSDDSTEQFQERLAELRRAAGAMRRRSSIALNAAHAARERAEASHVSASESRERVTNACRQSRENTQAQEDLRAAETPDEWPDRSR
jgi:hypothetical protein